MSAINNIQSVLASGKRPSRPSGFAATRTFVWRTFLKIRRVPEQLGDVILIPILFTLIFTYMFGGALTGSTSVYLQYLLPGTLAMTVLLVTIYTGVTLNTDISKGVFDRFRSLPIWRPSPLVGALLGDTFRYIIASGLVIAIGLLLGFRPADGITGVLAAVGLVLAFAFSISWIWVILGLVLRTPGAVQIFGLVILFPLTFVSNVFVDPATMPSWLQIVIQANPVSHLATAARGLMHGTAAASDIYWVLGACGVLVGLFAPLATYLYHHKSTR